jgi:preprotein translocase subunit SecA
VPTSRRIIGRYAAHLETYEAECGQAKKQVLEAGGLHVLGTERHESRRVDNQLRGRAGRQGDPGKSSQFYLSLEDDLMRMFGGDKLVAMMDRLGMEDDVPIEARMVSKSIENAQRRVEGHHFDIRKNLIEYDDVMNQQRKAIYGLRRAVLGESPMVDETLDMAERVVGYVVDDMCPKKASPEEWRIEELVAKVNGVFGTELAKADVASTRRDEIEEKVWSRVEKRWFQKQGELGERFVVVGEHLLRKEDMPVTAKEAEPVWRYLLRQLYLRQIDTHWREHLTQMDHLKEGIHLRGYGQRDPKLEYKREGYELYASMVREVDYNVSEAMWHVEIRSADEGERENERLRRAAAQLARAAQLAGGSSERPDVVADAVPSGAAQAAVAAQAAPEGGGDSEAASALASALQRSAKQRPGRNDACWCGSGKKYKKCHLEEDERAARPTA